MTRRIRPSVVTTVFGILCAVPATVAGQCAAGFDWDLAPDLVDAEGRSPRLGVQGSLDWCDVDYDLLSDHPHSKYMEVAARGMYVWDDVRVPEDMFVRVGIGGGLWWREVGTPDPNAGPDDPVATGYDRGIFGGGAHLAYESSSDREERAFAFGAEARWVHLDWRWAPSVVLTLDGVKPEASVLRELSTLDEELFGRVTARGYWLIPVALLELEIDLAAFDAFGLHEQLAAAGWDDGTYARITVGLDPGWRLGNRFTLDRFAVSYADGQLPSAPDDRKAWTIALEFGSG